MLKQSVLFAFLNFENEKFFELNITKIIKNGISIEKNFLDEKNII